jgi:hypothetical protein
MSESLGNDLQTIADAQNSVHSYFSATSVLTVLAMVMIPILGVVWSTYGLHGCVVYDCFPRVGVVLNQFFRLSSPHHPR